MSKLEITKEVSKEHDNYRINQINTNRFTHHSFITALDLFRNEEKLDIKEAGYSQEGRVIKSVTFGKGKTKVLLWSQMHGNESTATRAILDLLNFLVADDKFNDFRTQTAEQLTLLFIPMLNPDGTERFQRRTGTEIDMNRDAVELQTPEGKLLMDIVDEFKPTIGFNLHDQRKFYNVKNTEVPSSISFLAPAYNESRDVNVTRKKAMQLIAGMNKTLQEYIPGGVGLYDDTYSFRSFGDAIQAKGVSTILVESGWLPNDIEKEAIRKLNFTALLKAFKLLSGNTLTNYSENDYFNIPPIDTKLFDVLIKDVRMGDSASVVDIGINRYENLIAHPAYYVKGAIDDIGDLSANYGFETIKSKGLTVIAGKTVIIKTLEELCAISVKRFLNQGVLFVLTTDLPFEDHVPLPINVLHPRKLKISHEVKFDGHANFLLVDSKKKIKYIILNGSVICPNQIDMSVNGLVIA